MEQLNNLANYLVIPLTHPTSPCQLLSHVVYPSLSKKQSSAWPPRFVDFTENILLITVVSFPLIPIVFFFSKFFPYLVQIWFCLTVVSGEGSQEGMLRHPGMVRDKQSLPSLGLKDQNEGTRAWGSRCNERGVSHGNFATWRHCSVKTTVCQGERGRNKYLILSLVLFLDGAHSLK